MGLSTTLLTILVISSFLITTVSSRQCPHGQYSDVSTRTCVTCSGCPVDQIIRRPCTKHKDTACGPFYEFEFFNVRDKKWPAEFMSSIPKPEEGLPPKEKDGIEDNSNTSGQPVTQHHNELSWKHLCFGLITAQVLMLAVVIAYVFIRHFCRRHSMDRKTITVTDPSDPTIFYNARIIQQQQISSTPSITSSSSSPSTATKKKKNKSSSNHKFHYLEKHLQRMFQHGSSGSNAASARLVDQPQKSGNLYVDPMGRVYCRAAAPQPHPALKVHGPIGSHQGDISPV